MNVKLNLATPDPQPDVTDCILAQASVDFATGVLKGHCVLVDAAGAVQGSEPFELELDPASLASLAGTMVTTLQAAGKLPPGTISVTP